MRIGDFQYRSDTNSKNCPDPWYSYKKFADPYIVPKEMFKKGENKSSKLRTRRENSKKKGYWRSRMICLAETSNKRSPSLHNLNRR